MTVTQPRQQPPVNLPFIPTPNSPPPPKGFFMRCASRSVLRWQTVVSLLTVAFRSAKRTHSLCPAQHHPPPFCPTLRNTPKLPCSSRTAIPASSPHFAADDPPGFTEPARCPSEIAAIPRADVAAPVLIRMPATAPRPSEQRPCPRSANVLACARICRKFPDHRQT